MHKMEDLTGLKVNRLLVIRFDHMSTHGSYWLCECDCGNTKVIRGADVKNGSVKSCGCLRSETVSRNNKKADGFSMLNKVFDMYKRVAKRENRIFDIDLPLFKELTSSNCFYCGISPVCVMVSKHNSGNYKYNGLDRVDNNRGYEKDNIVPCCETCNKAKLQMSLGEFLNWIKRVYNYTFKKEN